MTLESCWQSLGNQFGLILMVDRISVVGGAQKICDLC